jgi:TRAP-type C4-dicarboxylate transport system permease small subunit
MLKRVAEHLKRVVSPVSRVLNDVSMVVLTAVMFLVVADVLMRRLFNAPIIGANDIRAVGFALVVFLPMGWCALMDRHVDLTVVVTRLPKKAQQYIGACMMLLTTAILGVTCWQLMRQGIRLQTMSGETPVVGIPYYPFVYLATLGMLMMTLVFFIKFLLELSNLMEQGR